uniref:Uncharacterized protein n=1 Tax=Eutreptiella gymnastica TaxID=73025 RepID=A0A7S4GBT1_9EUGL
MKDDRCRHKGSGHGATHACSAQTAQSTPLQPFVVPAVGRGDKELCICAVMHCSLVWAVLYPYARPTAVVCESNSSFKDSRTSVRATAINASFLIPCTSQMPNAPIQEYTAFLVRWWCAHSHGMSGNDTTGRRTSVRLRWHLSLRMKPLVGPSEGQIYGAYPPPLLLHCRAA